MAGRAIHFKASPNAVPGPAGLADEEPIMRSGYSIGTLILVAFAGAAIGGTVFLVAGWLAFSVLGSTALPSPFPAPLPVPTNSPSAPGTIHGLIFHDECQATAQTLEPGAAIPAGCVQGPQGLMADGRLSVGEVGIAGIVVELGSGSCPASQSDAVVSARDGSFALTNRPSGKYCLSVRATSSENAPKLLPGLWTAPVVGIDPAAVDIELNVEHPSADIDFGWDYQFLPEAKSTATPPPPSPTATPICSNALQVLGDVETPDGTIVGPGKSFNKIWRLKNIGTCRWGTGYSLVYDSENAMGGVSGQSLSGSVPPGSTVDLKLALVAPTTPGPVVGFWKLADPAGHRFGSGDHADQPFWVKIVVGPPANAASGGWKGEYFTNLSLKGSPKLSRTDSVIDFDWGRGSPASGIPADDFSVRWTGKASFDTGSYRFHVWVDDGARLFLDGQQVLDAWEDGSARELTVDAGLAKGTHTVVLEYYEHTHDARIRLSWEKISGLTITDWKGEYWKNETLKGTPALVRNDKKIDFNWKNGAPVGLPADGFSARWTRKVDFKNGSYLFSAQANDGMRVFLDGKLVLDAWANNDGSEVFTFIRSLKGKHTLEVEYHEHTGNASAKFWWEKQTPTAEPSPADTEVPTVEPDETPGP
jgi:hypothetical protein